MDLKFNGVNLTEKQANDLQEALQNLILHNHDNGYEDNEDEDDYDCGYEDDEDEDDYDCDNCGHYFSDFDENNTLSEDNDGEPFDFNFDDDDEWPEIEDVVFNEPATIVYWSDDTKTVVVAKDGDKFDRYVGLMLCIAKKAMGNGNEATNLAMKWLDIAKKHDDRKAKRIEQHAQNVLEDRKHKQIHAERVKALEAKTDEKK